ncbi:MAG: hypothetical protein HZB55_20545 [Deltaproteobacteria bacterium]|nr:hypothetical protein [Deltaproteobacteria bacterium]
MKPWTLAVCIALLAPAAVVGGVEKTPAPAAKAGTILEVSTLMREVDKHKGPIRVEGVVSKVFPKEQQLGLMDAAEFKKCGRVTCADMVLPVRWGGAMPDVKSLVRLDGEIRKSGEKLEFVAKSLEKVPGE